MKTRLTNPIGWMITLCMVAVIAGLIWSSSIILHPTQDTNTPAGIGPTSTQAQSTQSTPTCDAPSAQQIHAMPPNTWVAPGINEPVPYLHQDTLPDAPAGMIYTPGQPVGAPEGATILAGHVNYAPGILSDRGGEPSPWNRLHDLHPCQSIVVTDETGHRHTYKITGITDEDQDNLPEHELFRADGPPTLHLITCTPAPTDQGQVLRWRNLIVTAHLVQ